MSPLLIALLGVMLLPLFVATWRASLVGLCCQGLLIALLASRFVHAWSEPASWLLILDLVVVRGIGAPLVLYRVLKAQNTPARNDVIPPNLLSWTLALALVLLAFSFAEALVPELGDERTLVAVASSGILLGFLVLATQSHPFSQMIGVLRIETAIALLEQGGERHELPLELHLGILGTFIATVVLFRWYLQTIRSVGDSADGETSTTRPTL